MANAPHRDGAAASLQEAAARAGAAPIDAEPEVGYAELGIRIGDLIDSLEAHPDDVVGVQLDELLVAFDRLHRDALRRLAGLLAHHDLLDHAMTDPIVAMVLDMYELSTEKGNGVGSASGEAEPAAVGVATDRSAPTLPLIRLQDIRRFPAATMPASSSPLAPGPEILENLLVAGPAVTAPHVTAGSSPPKTAADATSSSSRPAAPLTDETGVVVPADGPPEWSSVFAVEHAPPGAVVASADGEVLICDLDGVLHALRNRCGGTPLPLHFGEIVGGRLACPWHRGCTYDLATGESSSGRRTVVYPVRLEEGHIRVALNHGRSTGPLQPAGLRAAPM